MSMVSVSSRKARFIAMDRCSFPLSCSKILWICYTSLVIGEIERLEEEEKSGCR